METSYKGRCPRCAAKDHFTYNLNRLVCKHCGYIVGAKLNDNVEVSILPSWEDFARWRKTVFNKDS